MKAIQFQPAKLKPADKEFLEMWVKLQEEILGNKTILVTANKNIKKGQLLTEKDVTLPVEGEIIK